MHHAGRPELQEDGHRGLQDCQEADRGYIGASPTGHLSLWEQRAVHCAEVEEMMYLYGDFVRVLKLDEEPYGEPIDSFRAGALGRVCEVTRHFTPTEEDDVLKDGRMLLQYAHLSERGVDYVTFYSPPEFVEPVEPTEALILLYSPHFTSLIHPYGEKQTSAIF